MKPKTRVRTFADAKAKTASTTPDNAGDWSVLVLSLTMLMATALGMPSEEMLQDTFKSIVLSWGTLVACLVFLGFRQNQPKPLHWHPVAWLPVSLTAYALGSMVWSHTYLAGVESARWFVFTAIFLLGIYTFDRNRIPRLALGIHLGATMASVWTALQFWFDFGYFPQGAAPASTFVNRNFFAEYAVCALPLSMFLLTREKQTKWIYALTLSIAFNITALMMTGTRGALAAFEW